MDKQRIKIFLMVLVGFISVAAFWFGQNKIEGFFLGELKEKSYAQIASMRSDILGRKFQAAKPLREHGIEDLIIQATAAISVRVDKNDAQKILFEKNTEQILPIASLTKLMTGLVVLENCNLNQQVIFSKAAASMQGEANFFKAGEAFYSKDLLYSCLIESSNRAGQALAESLGKDRFIDLMNAKAEELGLNNTHFINPTGLDPDYPEISSNFSNARDLVYFLKYLLKNNFFIEVSSTKEFDIYGIDGGFHHKAINTNQLLWEMPEILFGKTGQTPFAKKCLVIVYDAPDNNGYIINVILGSQDHFEEMRKLVDWAEQAYVW